MSETRIKIISNPYNREISFQRWDGEWVPITTGNEHGSELHDEGIATGFFPFKAEEVVRIILKEYQVGGQVVTLVFEGTDDEYEELCAICEMEDMASFVHVERSDRYLLNARDVLPEIVRVFQVVRPLVDESITSEDPTIEWQLEKFDDVSKDVIPLCVMGNYSSGKSTFINALIGQELLPSGDEPVTARVYQIRCSHLSGRGCISFLLGDQPVRLEFDENGLMNTSDCHDTVFYEQIAQAVAEAEVPSLISYMNRALAYINGVTLPSNRTGNSGFCVSDRIDIAVPFHPDDAWIQTGEFLIFDTPGENSLTNADHSRVLREAMEGLSNGLPIYVTTYDSLDNAANRDLYDRIKSIEAIDERFAMIVVNKADAADIKLRDFDGRKRRQILDMAVPRNLYAQGIFFVSSIMGLGAKLDGEFESESYAEKFEDQERKYSNPRSRFYKTLYRFNIQPRQIEDRTVRESSECPDLILANSGLYCVEQEIGRFAQRYSAYNKAHMSYTLIRQLLQDVSAMIAATRTRIENARAERVRSLDSEKGRVLGEFESYETSLRSELPKRYVFYVEKAVTARRWSTTEAELRKRERVYLTGFGKSFHAEGNAEEYADKKLLDVLKAEYEHAVADMSEVIDSNSRAFWDAEAKKVRKELCEIAAGSNDLSASKRRTIEDLIISYPAPYIHRGKGPILQRRTLNQVFRFLFIFTIRSNRLDLAKVANAYNKAIYNAFIDTNRKTMLANERSFYTWLQNLLVQIFDHIADFNPVIRKQQEQIERDDKRLSELSEKAAVLERCAAEISSMIEWQE